jgi:hypothetical protein
MPYDFILHSEQLEHALEQAGFNIEADRLEDARLRGATSGEILMGLRFECKKILRNAMIDESLRKRAVGLIKEIDATGV